MYKITKDGKTIVGNNEDWISPNSQFWFEPGEKGEFGVANVGLINDFAQGAFNEAGLVFDGFANYYLAVNNVEGKIEIPIQEAVKKVMHTMTLVGEVKEYLSTINLSMLAGGQLVFVDKTGDYLIVEGDELILGKEAEKAFSNFYYSQIESLEDVELQNFKNGMAFMNSTKPSATIEHCAAAMNSLSNLHDLTQYSTIYDLENLTIRLYLYHDYEEYVELDLRAEIAKGKRKVMMVDLFPVDAPGRAFYEMFNDPKDPTRFLREWIGDPDASEQDLVDSGFADNMNLIGYEWFYDKEDVDGAISIFEYASRLMPNQSNLHDSLAEAQWSKKNFDEAIKSYSTALSLDPQNDRIFESLSKVWQERLQTQ